MEGGIGYSTLDELGDDDDNLQEMVESRTAEPCRCQGRGCRKDAKLFLLGAISAIAAVAVAAGCFLLLPSGHTSLPELPPVPQNVSLTATGPTTVALQWSGCVGASANLSDTFLLQVGSSEEKFRNMSTIDGNATCRATLQRLSADTLYCARLRAQNVVGVSGWSSPKCVKTKKAAVPAAPPAPMLVAFNASKSHGVGASPGTGNDRVSLLWFAAPDNGGENITRVELLNAAGEILATGRANATSHELTFKLQESLRGSLLSFSVRTCNAVGCSADSAPLRCVTAQNSVARSGVTFLCNANAQPRAPSGIQLVSASHDRAFVGFMAIDSSCHAASYEIQRSDFWTRKGIEEGPLVSLGASDLAVDAEGRTSFCVERLLPGAAYSLRMRAVSIDGVSQWSEPLPFTVPNDGACGNIADISTQRDNFDTMVNSIQSCMLGCLGKDRSCVVDCVTKDVGLSKACADCWGSEAQCVFGSCLKVCLAHPTSAECLQCTNEKCMPALERCSGLPRYTFPNPS